MFFFFFFFLEKWLITTKLKPQLADHINSWNNYVKVNMLTY